MRRDKGCWRFGQPPQGLTMKRKLAPRGMTLPRRSLWRFTYSLIKSTSSSCGKNSALKTEARSSTQDSHSHSFKTPPRVKGTDWKCPSRAKSFGASMVHRPREASAHAPTRPGDLPIHKAVQASRVPPRRERREKCVGKPGLQGGGSSLQPWAELTKEA